MWFYTSNKFATNSALVFKIQRANDLYSWDASYSVWEVSCRFSFCCRSSYAEYDDGSAQVTLCDYLFSLVFKAQLCSDHIFGPILLPAVPSWSFGITVKCWPDWCCKTPGVVQSFQPGSDGSSAFPAVCVEGPGCGWAVQDQWPPAALLLSQEVMSLCWVLCQRTLLNGRFSFLRVTSCKPRGRYGYDQSSAGKLNSAGEKPFRGGIPQLCVRLLTLTLTNR